MFIGLREYRGGSVTVGGPEGRPLTMAASCSHNAWELWVGSQASLSKGVS